MFTFDIHQRDPGSRARTGTIRTDHGAIPTPIFMPVGTLGTVKGVHQRDLANDIDARIILGNTYHLYLRPGTEILREAGGLHRFMGWERPILTDSGGYQVYSLSQRRKISEDGVTFQSHIDGSSHLFTPESVMAVQRAIGADIIMAFDECPPYPCDHAYARTSMELTHRWLRRCIQDAAREPGWYGYEQTLFPIVQGGTYDDLRRASAEFVAAQGLPGNAIGGLSVGEPAEEMYRVTELVCAILPEDRPRYLMGVGTPANLLECIARGVDMFDCVLPSRNGRHGMLYTSQGILNIRNAKWKADFSPLDPEGPPAPPPVYTKAYLRHLIHSGERLGGQIATLHNLRFYLWLLGQARQHIAAGDFAAWKDRLVPRLDQRL